MAEKWIGYRHSQLLLGLQCPLEHHQGELREEERSVAKMSMIEVEKLKLRLRLRLF
jgi:hypothetical protein